MSDLYFNVTLVDGTLNVDESNTGHHMLLGDQGPITWALLEDPASSSFNALNATNPGFAWKEQPPDGAFGTPVINGCSIVMTADNTVLEHAGKWIYQLYATINGTQYSTLVSLHNPTATNTDPCIENDRI